MGNEVVTLRKLHWLGSFQFAHCSLQNTLTKFESLENQSSSYQRSCSIRSEKLQGEVWLLASTNLRLQARVFTSVDGLWEWAKEAENSAGAVEVCAQKQLERMSAISERKEFIVSTAEVNRGEAKCSYNSTYCNFTDQWNKEWIQYIRKRNYIKRWEQLWYFKRCHAHCPSVCLPVLYLPLLLP